MSATLTLRIEAAPGLIAALERLLAALPRGAIEPAPGAPAGDSNEDAPEPAPQGPTTEATPAPAAVERTPCAPEPGRRAPPAVRPAPEGVTTPVPPVAPVLDPMPPRGGQQPVIADRATIIAWGVPRGLDAHTLDLKKTNAKRISLGLPPYQLETWALRKTVNGARS